MSDEDKLAKLKAEVYTLRITICDLLEYLNGLPLGDHELIEGLAEKLGNRFPQTVAGRHKYPFWHRK